MLPNAIWNPSPEGEGGCQLIAIIAVFSGVIGLFTGQPEMAVGILVGIVAAILAAVSREISFMLADIADSTLEANRKKGAA